MRTLESHLTSPVVLDSIQVRKDNIAKLNTLLDPYPVRLELIESGNQFSFIKSVPSCLISLDDLEVNIIPMDTPFILKNDKTYIAFFGVADSSQVDLEVTDLKDCSKYFYSSHAFTLERVDNEHIMILSKFFNFAVYFNLNDFNYRIFGNL